MSKEHLALAETHNLPIRHEGSVHNGKVRSVYWLTKEDSIRIIKNKKYNVQPNAQLGVMVTSDRLSAFDVIWHAEEGLKGVPGKGASLNAISKHWFDLFAQANLAGHHILDIPHPLVWIVQRARPVFVEAVARQYMAGSMSRSYASGERVFCGIHLPEGLKENGKLPTVMITPSTKGVMRGLPDVPEEDDVNIPRDVIMKHFKAFGFKEGADIERYEELLKKGFAIIDPEIKKIGQLLVDTKFEFGYITEKNGKESLIYMDEVGTPDSSRMWDANEYKKGNIVENSKEGYRQFLLSTYNKDVLLDKKRMPERRELAIKTSVPVSRFMDVSKVYTEMAEKITGKQLPKIVNAKQEIVGALKVYEITS